MTAPDAHSRRIPLWIWGIMVGLSGIVPITFVWAKYFPPPGTVSTGIHGVDGAVFITCMRMFDTGFFSPFANCRSPLGTHSSAYFAAPFFWMYGILGSLGRAFRLDEVLLLGLANGLGGFLYLLAVYLFLREAFPKQANLAFLLFALAGGPGGVLYIITWLLGVQASPLFEDYFYRYALQQLFEGARLSPVLAMSRLYYTASMACCVAALTCFLKSFRVEARRNTALSMMWLFLGTFINLRYGPMAWAILALYLLADRARALRDRFRLGATLVVPVILAGGLGWLMLRRSPMYIEGATTYVRTHMWFSTFLSAVLFHLAVVPRQTMLGTRTLPRIARLCAYAGVGYLVAYFVLYVLYNAYYGNLWRCLDVTSAIRISDWALAGAGIGILWNLLRPGPPASRSDASLHGWITLWLLAFLTVGISAFGQGWFLRFCPERVMIFLGLPIAILAALGIEEWRRTRPRMARLLLGTMIGCGICAIAVASACFQGVLGHRPGKGPYGYAHCELMNQADADALQSLPGGVVLTPVTYGPSFGDVLAQRPNTSVVFGFGSVNLSDRDQGASKADCRTFFAGTTSETVRKAIVDDWCVDYVYCPDSHPVDPDVVTTLQQTPWLEEVTRCGNAMLFRVLRAHE
jgi:hypothetical protein